jgi:hypothetical protein
MEGREIASFFDATIYNSPGAAQSAGVPARGAPLTRDARHAAPKEAGLHDKDTRNGQLQPRTPRIPLAAGYGAR